MKAGKVQLNNIMVEVYLATRPMCFEWLMSQKNRPHLSIDFLHMKIIILPVFFLTPNFISYGQGNANIRKQVLHKSIVGKEFLFKQGPNSETKLKYLGNVKTKSGKILRFLNSIYLSGLYEDSKRATCQILVYNEENRYIGSYSVGGIWYLPDRLEKKNLIFLPYKGCTKTNTVNFENGIPKQINILCTGTEGDVFTFSTSN